MTRATLATALAGLALAGPAAAAQVPEIADASAERGWPHTPSPRELTRLAEHVSLDLAAYLGTEPNVTRCRSFRVCRSGWAAGGRARTSLRVWEDGSYRITAVLFPVTTYKP